MRYGKRRERVSLHVSVPKEVIAACTDIENFSAFFTACLERHLKSKDRDEQTAELLELLRIMDIKKIKTSREQHRLVIRNLRRNMSFRDISELYQDFLYYFNRNCCFKLGNIVLGDFIDKGSDAEIYFKKSFYDFVIGDVMDVAAYDWVNNDEN